MTRIYIKIGESVPLIDGVAVCTEIPVKAPSCDKCCFCNDPCGGIACAPADRPDCKSVIFIEKKGGKK